MLEQKLRLKKAMETLQPKCRVYEFYQEYDEAYQRLHKPSEKHNKDYVDLYFAFLDYMNRKDIPRGKKRFIF